MTKKRKIVLTVVPYLVVLNSLWFTWSHDMLAFVFLMGMCAVGGLAWLLLVLWGKTGDKERGSW